MERTPPPLLGFNNNVRYHGRIFHIQTEDSGVKHARIVTHLFADGGRIVKSTRTDYAEHLGRPDMVDILRRVMKEQHKAMFFRLRAGELDALIEAACGPLPVCHAQRGEPASIGAREAAPSPVIAARETETVTASRDSEPRRIAAQGHPLSHEEPSPPTRQLTNPNLRPVPPSVAPPPGELELDEALLEGKTHARLSRSLDGVIHPGRSRDNAAWVSAKPTLVEQARPEPVRPPNIFEASPSEHSIFGDGLTHEKSLDEVILSYLAEDVDRGPHE